MNNPESDFFLECVKRDIQDMSRSELEQKIYDLVELTRKQSEHIQTLNLIIKALEEKCELLSEILAKFS